MFTRTSIQVSKQLFDKILQELPNVDFKLSLNKPTGRFLYDPWVIKEEFKNSAWEELLNTLPSNIGEARLIVLKPGTGYQSHSDIDDRYHLNISGDKYSYLVNTDTNIMYPVQQDLFWYNMNAGPRHSAVNLGKHNRVQLVVRKLLPDVQIEGFIKIDAVPDAGNNYFRFDFDDFVSPWLNQAVKESKIANFEFSETHVSFYVSTEGLQELRNLNLKGFNFVETR
jgi:hypothetical protein